MAYLINNDVEETHPLAYREQGLGPVHAHRRTQTPIEFDDHGLLESCCSIFLIDGGIAEHARIEKRINGVLRNESADTLLQLAVIVGEDIDGLLRDAGCRHLVLGKFQTRLAHTQIVVTCLLSLFPVRAAQARTSRRSPRSTYDPVSLPRRPCDART